MSSALCSGLERNCRGSPPHTGGDSLEVLCQSALVAWRFLFDLGQGERYLGDSHSHQQYHESTTCSNLVYLWPIDHLPTRAEMVECFAKGCPYQMETEGKGNFQLSNLSNDVRCLYHILTSWVHPMLSHTMITIERYLYTLLTETLIDFGSLVTTTMMSIQLTN
jgi:hypothetical protein